MTSAHFGECRVPPPPDAGLDAAQVRLWDAVRESLRGSHHDYTRGPVGRAVLLLAIPMVLETALESVFAVVDVFFVARLGAAAVAAVGLTEAMLALIYALAMGLAMGATAVVARRVGEHDADGAARAAVQATAMRVLWLGNAINLVLDPLLIFGIGPFPEMGVTGAAVATTTGRTVAVLWAISRLLRPNGRIVVFALLPAWGLSDAAATMVGQSLGALDPEHAERSVWIAGFYNMRFLGLTGLLFFIWADELVRLFTEDMAVLGHAASALRIVATGFLFYAYGVVITHAFNGAGDTLTPTLLNIAVFWAFEIPLAYVLAVPLGMGPRGVFVAVAVAFSALAVVSGIVFRRGWWKETRV